MTENLRREVLHLLLDKHLSSGQVGKRLGLSPSEVMAIKNSADFEKTLPASAADPPSGLSDLETDETEQIRELRRRVREVLLERFDRFPPPVLLRLWQLIEDPKLLEAPSDVEKDPFDIPEDVREKIFELLDDV